MQITDHARDVGLHPGQQRMMDTIAAIWERTKTAVVMGGQRGGKTTVAMMLARRHFGPAVYVAESLKNARAVVHGTQVVPMSYNGLWKRLREYNAATATNTPALPQVVPRRSLVILDEVFWEVSCAEIVRRMERHGEWVLAIGSKGPYECVDMANVPRFPTWDLVPYLSAQDLAAMYETDPIAAERDFGCGLPRPGMTAPSRSANGAASNVEDAARRIYVTMMGQVSDDNQVTWDQAQTRPGSSAIVAMCRRYARAALGVEERPVAKSPALAAPYGAQ